MFLSLKDIVSAINIQYTVVKRTVRGLYQMRPATASLKPKLN